MATPTQAQYTIAANAILAVIQGDVAQLPGWEQGFVPASMEAPLAGAAAKAALDALFAQSQDPPFIGGTS